MVQIKGKLTAGEYKWLMDLFEKVRNAPINEDAARLLVIGASEPLLGFLHAKMKEWTKIEAVSP